MPFTKARRRRGRPPTWLLKLPDAREQLAAAHGVPWVKTSTIQILFDLDRWQAGKLLRAWGASKLGRDLAIERTALLQLWQEVLEGRDFTQEVERRQRLAEALLSDQAEVRRARELAFRPPPGTPRVRRRRDLPANIQHSPGHVEIRYATPQELLASLLTLSQTFVWDLQGWEEVEPGWERAFRVRVHAAEAQSPQPPAPSPGAPRVLHREPSDSEITAATLARAARQQIGQGARPGAQPSQVPPGGPRAGRNRPR